MSGIYIHIPFCKQACHYCNFHFSTSLKLKEEMIHSILQEIELRHNYLEDKNLQTIYLGGGTPSLLNESDLNRIFDKIGQHFSINDNVEITLEANPDDLTSAKVKELSLSPVNRLSIGVQSFFEDELRWMNRAHNSFEAEYSIKCAQDYGIENISMDLIFGIPISDHEKWERNLEKTIALDIPHISAYALTIEAGTALNHFVKVGKAIEASDEFVMEQFDRAIYLLTHAGYIHYEISNYAKPSSFAVHNTNYWKSEHYLGLGPSAHSFNGHSRSANIANNPLYIKAINNFSPKIEVEVIDVKTSYNEYVMTRLRTMWGINGDEIQDKYGQFSNYFQIKAQELLKKNWVELNNSTYTLTIKGKHFADAATVELFLE